MIKTILTLIAKVLESKLKKSGLEEIMLRNTNYIIEAKKIWNMIDENNRISKTVEENLESKAEQFDNILLAKFPELTEDDVQEIRQSIAGEINQGKAAVLDNSELLKKLHEDNTKLQAENISLKDQLNKIQTAINPITVQA